jgi:chemotaxis methyl-accepting protein methylase
MVPPAAPADKDEPGFQALTQKISRARGIRCESYKEKCLRRRIAVRMRARGVHTFAAYSKLLDDDAKEYELLLDALTINVTKFYRNPETWSALAKPHLADLWRARQGHLHVWSAGCASGEEPYTIAVVLAEIARIQGDGQTLAHVRIDATDIDRASLERTAAATYDDAAFTEMPADLVRRYFTATKPRQPNADIRRTVQPGRHDLTHDRPPRRPYDLIVCRNVVIYFDRALQERLFAAFASALAPGGVLVLGKVETLLGPARDQLELLDARERIYRRPA